MPAPQFRNNYREILDLSRFPGAQWVDWLGAYARPGPEGFDAIPEDQLWRGSNYGDLKSAGLANWDDTNSPLWQLITNGGAMSPDWVRSQMAQGPERAMQFLSPLAPNPADWNDLLQGYHASTGQGQGLANAVTGAYEANANAADSTDLTTLAEAGLIPALATLLTGGAAASSLFGAGATGLQTGATAGAIGGGISGAQHGETLGDFLTSLGLGGLTGGALGAASDYFFPAQQPGTVDPVTAFDAAQGTPMHEFGGYVPATPSPVADPSTGLKVSNLPQTSPDVGGTGTGLRPASLNYSPTYASYSPTITYDPGLGSGIRAVGGDVANLAELTQAGLGGVSGQISGLEGALGSGLQLNAAQIQSLQQLMNQGLLGQSQQIAGMQGALGSGLQSVGGDVASLADLTRHGLGGVSNQITGMQGSLGTGIGGVSNQVAGLSDSVNAGNTQLSGQLGSVENNLGSGIRAVGQDVDSLEELTRTGLGGVQNQITGMEGSLGTGIRGVGSDVANLSELTKYGLAGVNTGISGLGDKVSGLGDIFTKGIGGLGTALGGGLAKLGSDLLADNAQNRLAQILGGAIPAAIGAYASNQQQEAYERLAREQMAMGGPSRQRFEDSFAPGFSMENDPAFKGAIDAAMQSQLRGLSTQGNPYGNPGGLAEALKYVTGNVALPALQNYRSLNANAGGLSRFAEAAPGTSMAGINAGKGVWDSLGVGAGNILNPPTTLEQLLKQLKGSGLSVGLT